MSRGELHLFDLVLSLKIGLEFGSREHDFMPRIKGSKRELVF
jgi:hypothetical protein